MKSQTTHKKLAASMKPGETVWVGETRPRTGDPGSAYGVRCTDSGFEVVSSANDNRGVSFAVDGTQRPRGSVYPAYFELRKEAAELCDMLYR